MMLIEWNENLCTGITVVDEQHRGLVRWINTVAPRLAFPESALSTDTGPLCDRLMDYAAEHFKTEEDLMAARGIDPRVLDHHRLAHRNFEAKVTSWKERTGRDERIPGPELLSFLAGWLMTHILGEDQTMARQIHAVDSGLPTDRAYREAGGYRTAPAENALTEILIGLYRQVIHRNS